MAITLEELQIKFTAQYGGLKNELNGIKQQLGSVQTASVKTSSALSGIGRIAKTFLTVYAGRALLRLGKDSISMANDVVESESLFAVSMKGMANDARAWSEELSDSLGLNAYNLRRNVGTFQTMFESMGLGQKAAYDMATGITELAEDMASFYNVDPEEMFTKLRAGITGETEPLKRLGIMVDENTVKQYALANGISKTGKELSQTEKLMARYGSIMQQTTNAQGDLARTINSPVNQIRVLNNTLDQAKIAFGQALMPLQSAVLPILNSLAKAATVAAQALAYLMGSLGGYGGVGVFANKAASTGAAVNAELTDSLNASAKAYKKAGGAAKQASKDAKVGLKVFDEVNKLTEETTKSGGGGVAPIEVPPIEPVTGYGDAIQIVSDKVKEAAEAIKKFWDSMKNSALGVMVEGAFDAVKWLWTDVIKPFGEWAIAHPDAIGNVLGAIGAGILTWKVGTMLSGGGALAKIGAALMAHPGLATLTGIAVGLTLIAGGLNSASQAAIDAENDKRFGNLSLSLEKLKNLTSTIGTPFTNAMKNLKEDFEALKTAGNELRALADLNAELIYGYKLKPEALTKDKIDELIASVQSEVDKNKDLLGAAQIKTTMGLEALFAGTSQDGTEILKLNNENWGKVKEEGAKLGKEYLKAVTDAAFDGVISAEEQQKINNLQQKLLEMTMLATDPDVVMTKMQIRKIGLNFDRATITKESVADFNKALNDSWKELETLMDEQGTSLIDYQMALAIQANPNITDAELKKIQGTVQLALDEQKLQANWEIEKVRISAPFDEVQKAYADALAESKPAVDALGKDYITKAMEVMLNSGWTSKDIKTKEGAKILATTVTALMAKGVESAQIPEGATKQAMQQWLDAFRPDYTKWKQLEAEYKRLGIAVPTELSNGISDYEAMLAVSGSISDLAYYVESQANLDTTTWSSEAKGIVAAITKGLTDGKIDVSTAASLLAQAAKGELDSSSLYGSGENFADGFIRGIQAKINGARAAAQSLAKAATSGVNNQLVINSPSKVGIDSGAFFGEGVAIGMENMANKVYQTSANLANQATLGMDNLNSSLNGNINGSVDVSGGGIMAAIEAGIERGVNRVMSALQINLNVDGEKFGSAAIRTINDTQRAAGRLLLEM